ncbi:MAG: hypothetical protein JOZ57_10750, partial [Abitibacteriaceae bacterium]|nr:hypothetical protein [Abditibacteriaceae bacterium]
MHPPAMARRDATTPATEIKSLDMHIPSAQLPTIHHLGISGGKDSTALLL